MDLAYYQLNGEYIDVRSMAKPSKVEEIIATTAIDGDAVNERAELRFLFEKTRGYRAQGLHTETLSCSLIAGLVR